MKIICVGRNYADHAKELKNEVPSEPVIFMKPKNALLQNNHPFYYPEFTDNLHYECELVLRICKNGKHIQEKFADKYYDQLGIGIDFTARDLQDKQKQKGLPWEIAKAFDNSAVVGQFMPITPELDKKDINFCLYKNKQIAQQGNTKDLLFTFDFLIAYISKFFTLNIGDLVFTGTPAGVGPVEIGDKLEAFIENDSLLEFEIK
ncbi:2-keto-4-pentenoate hydratase/2-oxohepta-3-ene-1,7-dioic acid hydratase (catechol pathway) [Chitinophaga sp. CF118]|uniref:fumarylacetoacetate hydrolase family protein n=1 Tax=Chitinophaga sp. CF118 TaxID=1884367 RepID=UPI0008DEAA51|nr:fumarylacetoacetate hydrolase family protein [Chitinophaga sp. CF118]SFE79505.1 2-keto-4-pentenoate hydratase/2-oxohepta-3-ene-1,7-dioic acid hydratase (catechol pathway) [Chitinophaga sp. CF118]